MKKIKVEHQVPGEIGTALSGTYGDLTMNSDGSYEYKANNAKSLNPGETATEYFTYTATDGETSVEGTNCNYCYWVKMIHLKLLILYRIQL